MDTTPLTPEIYNQVLKERDDALAKLRESEAKCAEMQELLKEASGELYHTEKSHWAPECPGCKVWSKINHVLLSSDCGRGFIPVAELERWVRQRLAGLIPDKELQAFVDSAAKELKDYENRS